MNKGIFLSKLKASLDFLHLWFWYEIFIFQYLFYKFVEEKKQKEVLLKLIVMENLNQEISLQNNDC